MAPLHDMLGNAGKIGTRKAGHADSLVAPLRQAIIALRIRASVVSLAPFWGAVL